MVKGPILKDALREIRSTFSRFLAIMVIIFLGTAFFVGIKTTGPDMRVTADRYFRDSSLMDFTLLSTVGFDSADISAIRAADGARGVMPAYSVDAMATISGRDSVVRVLSLPADAATADNASYPTADNASYLNRPRLISGRLPEQPGEAVIERNEMTRAQLPLGAHVSLRAGNETDLGDSLSITDFTIVGIVESPLYISRDRGTTTVGNGSVAAYMLIGDQDFKLPYYTAVYVTADLTPVATAYSKAYDDQVARVKDALTAVADRRQAARQDEIRAEAESALQDKENEYNTAAAQTRAKLDQTQAQLAQGKQQLAAGQAQQAQGEQSYAANRSALQAGGMSPADAEQQLAPVRAQLDASAAKLDATAAQLAASDKAYEAGRTQAENDLAKGATQLADARTKLADLPKVTWHILGRDTNSGYVEYQNATERMDAIALVFPVIFILVAILICVTSMSRMVEEQRGFIGTAKALGYSQGAIITKFLLYGAAAAVVGCLAGVAVGFAFLPTTIFRAYSMLFTLPRFIHVFNAPFALAALAISLAVTSLSVLSVGYGELQSNAATLLRPQAPKAGKRIWLERVGFIWRRLGFTQKVTARNLIRYRSRFYMTVIGVAGCTALLLVGLGLNDALRDIGEKQFGEIFIYQMSVTLKDGQSSADRATLDQTIDSQPGFAGREDFLVKNVNIAFGGQEKSVGLIVPSDVGRMGQFINLRDRVTGQKAALPDDAVMLTEKAATKLGVHVGDSIQIENGDGWLTATVAGTCENYFLHDLYLSPTLYQRLYGEAPAFNQIDVLLTTPLPAQQESAKAVLAVPGVSGVNLLADSLSRFQDIINSISAVFLILIVSAAALSFTVLYTLTNININERLREIATIKVLGFFDGEVAGFILRENLVLATIGAAVGLTFGTWLARFVIGTVEVDMVMFGRQIHPLSYVVAFALTLAFTGLVNLVMLRPLARINMTEALKTAE